MSGYHITTIPLGVYGKPSKITEEYLEFLDAVQQNNRLMSLLECSDLIGAIKGYAEANGSCLEDLLVMLAATERAFNDGTRKPRNS